MAARDPISETLQALGRTPEGDALRSVDAFLREDPKAASRLLDKLLPVLARPGSDAEAGEVALAVGSAYLAKKDAPRARELLVQALGLLGKAAPHLVSRGELRLASVETALGDKKAARVWLARCLGSVLELEEDALLGELSSDLRASGDELAAAVVDRLRRERSAGPRKESAAQDTRLEVVSKLTHALNSSIAVTAEPLYAILRAILEETRGERGFIMLHEGAALRFELGLTRDGRALPSAEFAYSTTVVDQALESGKCVLVPDVAASLRFASATSAQELGLGSALCAPLRVDRKRPGASPLEAVSLPTVRGIAGVIYVDSRTVGSFGESDARFFEILADCAVLALRASRTAAALAARGPAPSRSRPGSRGSAAEPAAPEATPAEVAADEKLAKAFPEFVTRHPEMRKMLRAIERAGPSDASILIKGESGTGKELVARALHRLSRRAQGPFVAIDCGAIADGLLTNELFGHEKGAFTGASGPRAGLLERASGGTLFLDEIGEMSPAMQASLLRALQEGEARRLGADKTTKVDVRVLSASNRDLRAMVERGEFRHDLLFRVAVVQIQIPPLRERQGDVPLLVEHVLEDFAAGAKTVPTLEPAAMARLEEHAWPGNIRELENVVRAATVTGSPEITLAEIDQLLAASPVTPPPPGGRAGPSGPALSGTLDLIEKAAIAQRLEQFGWNQVRTAESLGIDRNTLRRKVLRHGIVQGRE
jgi:two-component system response regulator HydG/two-component system response regulator AtoC